MEVEQKSGRFALRQCFSQRDFFEEATGFTTMDLFTTYPPRELTTNYVFFFEIVFFPVQFISQATSLFLSASSWCLE